MIWRKASVMLLRNPRQFLTFNTIKTLNRNGSTLNLNPYISHKKKNTTIVRTTKNFFCSENHFTDDIYDEEEVFNTMEDAGAIYQLADIKFSSKIDLNDELSEKIRNSASIQDVLTIINLNHENMCWEHIVQSIVMLWELHKILFSFNGLNTNVIHQNFSLLPDQVQNYISKFHVDNDFACLLNILEKNYQKMDIESLSYCLMYLNKLGLPLKHKTLQLLINEIQNQFTNDNYNLLSISTFATTLCQEPDIYSYYVLKDMIPTIYSFIESCGTAEEMKMLTITLHAINRIIPNHIVEEYKRKVSQMIETEIINYKEHETILKILMFLNSTHGRDESFSLMKKCILLLENNLNNLNPVELITLYEAFYKIQEPGVVLNEIQRCANRYLQMLKDDSNSHHDIQIKLMCCLVCFSASKRLHLDAFLEQFINYDLSYSALMEFYKLLLITKTTNMQICQTFWDKLLLKLDKMHEPNYLQVCNNYVNFYKKVNHFRYEKVEKHLNDFIDSEIQNGISIFVPSQCSIMACFTLAFGQSERNLEYFLYKINENRCQLNNFDCFNIAKGLQIAMQCKYFNYGLLMAVLEVVEKVTATIPLNLPNMNILLICYGYQNSYDNLIQNKIKENFEKRIPMTSKYFKNIAATFHVTDTLLPNIMDQMCDYITESTDNMLGFNVEKIVSLCYYLGYYPTNAQFFEIALNILIRDEKRLSALAYIQVTLALCYFQKLSDTLIKQIFNVEFLENIDCELANCYYKDTYPFRVRTNLMHLNRAVCLDYPEAKIPWFHQKYINEMKKYERFLINDFNVNVKKILMVLVKNTTHCQENVITPYGYHVDFICNINNKSFAILLLNYDAYTRYHVQLKGEYQLKIRHLEILGYEVVCIKSENWYKLKQNEHVEYVTKLLK